LSLKDFSESQGHRDKDFFKKLSLMNSCFERERDIAIARYEKNTNISLNNSSQIQSTKKEADGWRASYILRT